MRTDRTLLAVLFFNALALQVRAEDGHAIQTDTPARGTPHGADHGVIQAKAAPQTLHYGLQNAGVDAFAFGLAATGVGAENGGLLFTSLAIYALGSPIVHLAHREPLRAIGSLGLRGSLGTIGFVTGGFLSSKKGDLRRAMDGPLIGALVAGLVAAVLDDVLLAEKEVPASRSLTFSPSYRADRQEAMLNVSGTF